MANVLAGFIRSEATSDTSTVNCGDESCLTCSTADNATSCSGEGKTSFLRTVFGSTFEPLGADAPTILNVLFDLVMSFLLGAGILLIILSFVPFTA